MRNRTVKIAFLFWAYALAHFIAACQPDCECDPPPSPYFDYKQLTLSYNDPATAGKLVLELQADSITFLADVGRCRRFSLFAEALACDCLGNGDLGDKYGLTSIEIRADRDFDDALPAGAPLNGLFTFSTSYSTSRPMQGIFPVMFGYRTASIFLETTAKPQSGNGPFRFTVNATKSNGDTFTLQTGEINF